MLGRIILHGKESSIVLIQCTGLMLVGLVLGGGGGICSAGRRFPRQALASPVTGS